MKASEMTNEELASWLESITPDFEGYTSPVSDYFREAAARLRNVTVRSDNSAVIAELQRRLKVAEDALEKSLNYSNSEELRKAQRKAKNALAAIRGKGGAE